MAETIRNNFLKTLSGEHTDFVPLLLDGFHYSGVGYTLDNADDYAAVSHGKNTLGGRFLFATHNAIDSYEPNSYKREITHRALDHCPMVLTWPSYQNRYFMVPPKNINTESLQLNPTLKKNNITITTPLGDLYAVTYQNTYTRWHDRYPVNSFEDIEKIRSVTWELPQLLEPPNLEKIPFDLKGQYILTTRISSPFVCVAGMMPYQMFLELCATEIGFLKELTTETSNRIQSIADILLGKKNVDIVWMGGCEWITPPMASVDIYKELVQPFETKLISRIHEHSAMVHVHCHGNVSSTLGLIIDRGADFTEPVEPPPDGDILFKEAKQLTDCRMALGGNVEARLFSKGTLDEVKEATHKAFEGGTQRMVLMPTAEPIDKFDRKMCENYHTFIDVWEECKQK